MRSLFCILTFTLFLSFSASAQLVKNHDWSDSVEVTVLTEEEQKESAVYLKHYNFIEYAYGDNRELFSYHTIHRHVKINSDDAIQRFNKVYISMYNVMELVSIKARSISPKGEVKELGGSAIKDFKDDYGYEYKIFAIEGLEKGSEVEYIYTAKKKLSHYGREYFQSGIRARDCRFELFCPDDLIFECKGYNGNLEVDDSFLSGKKRYRVTAENVGAMHEEKYSSYSANLMRVDYYLKSVVGAYYDIPMYSWDKLAAGTVQNYYFVAGPEKRAVKRLIKSLKLKDMPKEEQIRAVEKYYKNNIALKENKEVDDRLDQILANKYADEQGMLKLYAATFKQLDIRTQIVFTSNRSEALFDPDFPNYRQLANAFLYFPYYEKYLAPSAYAYRYGIIPSDWTNNYGLFISQPKGGGSLASAHEARFIDPLSSELNRYNHDITLQIDDEEDIVRMDVTFILSGYYATSMHYINLQNEKQKKDMLEGMVTSFIKDAEIKKLELENKDFNISTVDTAYRLTASIESDKLLSRAGNKLLLKIGESIGPQDEMYQDEERKNDVENTYNRVFRRTIRFTVPEGYIIKNPGDLNMKVVCEDEFNESKVYGFVSSYTLEGNQLTVKIDEYYNKIGFPRERFEDFRKVVNAAADFNKIVLVLEKQ